MPSTYALVGSAEEISSSRSAKIQAAFKFASVSLTTEEGPTKMATSKNLELVKNGTAIIGQSNSILRYVAELDSSKSLRGSTELAEGQVDQWLEFTWGEIEVPLEALKVTTATGEIATGEIDSALRVKVKEDVVRNLCILDTHLLSKTFLVGDNVTIADISLACALSGSGWELVGGDAPTNVKRWFNTMINQPELGGAASTPSSSSTPSGSILFGGEAPYVTPNLFRRTRLRVKELFNTAPTLIGQTITVKGWARTLRLADKGKIIFLELNDGSCNESVQCVLGVETTTGFDGAKNAGGVGSR